MALNDDLKAAIEKNLSAEVGNTLKRRLESVDALEAKVDELQRKLKYAEELTDEYRTKLYKHEELDKRIEAATKAEAAAKAATIDKSISDLKDKHAAEKVSMMLDVVKSVFANNQYKYTVSDNGMMPVGGGQGGYFTAQHTRTIAGQGEGAPPPSPGDVTR